MVPPIFPWDKTEVRLSANTKQDPLPTVLESLLVQARRAPYGASSSSLSKKPEQSWMRGLGAPTLLMGQHHEVLLKPAGL